ncbi:transcriptional regulator BetI [compost metagenome]
MSTENAPSKKVTPKRKAPRASGRPLADAAVGQQRILDATILLLKTRAPEHLSILEIAGIAGVTRTLVRYYFGDLRGVLREATEQLMGQLQDRMEAALVSRGPLPERVYQRLLLRLEFMREHPHFERLALSEIYHGEDANASQGKTGNSLQRISRRAMELTAMLLGDSPADVDPRHIHLTILSVSAFIPTAQPLLDHLFGKGPKGDREIEKYLRFVSQMLADRIQQRP